MKPTLGGLRFVLPLLLAALTLATLVVQAAAPRRCLVGETSDLGCARGFETRERADGTAFRWTKGDSTVAFSGLGYGVPRSLMLALRSGRPAGSAPIPLLLLVNGRVLAHIEVPTDGRRYHLLPPPGPLDGEVLRARLRSPTFAPGSGRRQLGLIVAETQVLALPGPRVPGALLTLSLFGLGLAGARIVRGLLAARQPCGVQLAAGVGTMVLVSFVLASLPEQAIPHLPVGAFVACTAALLGWPGRLGHGGLRLYGAALAGGALLLLPLLLPPGPAWQTPLLVLLGALPGLAATVWLARQTSLPPLMTVLGAALLLRCLGIGARLLTGNTFLDADVELFYAYGMALRESGPPTVEYPSGAVLVWSALSLLAGDSRERFALLLPLLNIGCDLLIVASLYAVGWRLGSLRTGCVAATFYGLCPLLLPFTFAKYDALPTALLTGGLALFALAMPREPGLAGDAGDALRGGPTVSYGMLLAGISLGLGGAIKWTPLLAGPPLAILLLRSARLSALLVFMAGVLLGLGLPSLLFAVVDMEAFLAPYRLQGARSLTGQSLWFLLALALEPELIERLPRAWSPVDDTRLPVWLMVAVQLLVQLALMLVLLRRPTLRRALALAALAPTLFLLLNRVYSPQYMQPISVGLLLAMTLWLPRPRLPAALIVLATALWANLLIWPLFTPAWLSASALMFAATLGLSLWLFILALPVRRGSPAGLLETRTD
jgi:hypothetical protein